MCSSGLMSAKHSCPAAGSSRTIAALVQISVCADSRTGSTKNGAEKVGMSQAMHAFTTYPLR